MLECQKVPNTRIDASEEIHTHLQDCEENFASRSVHVVPISHKTHTSLEDVSHFAGVVKMK